MATARSRRGYANTSTSYAFGSPSTRKLKLEQIRRREGSVALCAGRSEQAEEEMRCPFCGTDDTQVKDSRPTDDRGAIRRRRFCPSCGARFTTFERVQL